VSGVAAITALGLAVGYCLLAPFLRRRPLAVWPSYAGVALLVGGGVTIWMLTTLTVVGITPTPGVSIVVAVLIAAAGVGVAVTRPVDGHLEEQPSPRGGGSLGGVVVAGCAAALAALGAVTLLAAARSTAWLDDTWFQWLPRGLMVEHQGLDPRVFTSARGYLAFVDFDYPLWWSLVTANMFRTGAEMHGVSVASALIVVAGIAAVARLLHGLVRPVVLWPGLLLMVTPSLIAQTQSGGADPALAVYVILALVAGSVWVVRGDRFALVVGIAMALTAASIKGEGLPQLALYGVILGAFAFREERRRVLVALTIPLAGVLGALPWRLWLATHDAPGRIRYGPAFHPHFMIDRADRIQPAFASIQRHLLEPRSWLLALPLLLVATLFATLRTRQLVWLGPAVAVAAGIAFWIVVYWAGPFDINLWLATSIGRVITALPLLAAAATPALVEAGLRARHP
jgi:hypothetical protein